MENLARFVLNLVSNSLYFLRMEVVMNLIHELPKPLPGSLSIYNDFLSLDIDLLKERYAGFLDDTMVSACYALLVLKYGASSYEVKMGYDKIFGDQVFTLGFSNVIQVARMDALTNIPGCEELREEWKTIEANIDREVDLSGGFGYDIGSLVEVLNTFGGYIQKSARLPEVRTLFKRLIEDDDFPGRYQSSVGPLLILAHDLALNEASIWDSIDACLKANKYRLSGLDIAGVIAAKRCFDERAYTVLDHLNLGAYVIVYEKCWNDSGQRGQAESVD